MMDHPRIRWKASIAYRHDTESRVVYRLMEEIAELDGLVDEGPHWDTIERIQIVRMDPIYPGLTVEEAEKI